MKKLLVAMLCIILLMGCGNGEEKPEDISEKAYSDAIKTIDIMDKYLDGDSDLEELMDELYEIDIDVDSVTDVEYFSTLDQNENGEYIDNSAEYPRDVSIYFDILDIQNQMSTLMLDIPEENKNQAVEIATEIRDELADAINYKD